MRTKNKPAATSQAAVGAQGQRNIRDSLVNMLSGLGGARDKGASGSSIYSFTPTPRYQLDAAYNIDPFAKKSVDIPAMDATRAWRQWRGDAQQVEQIKEAERVYDVRRKVQQALILARLYGGSLMLLGVGNDATWFQVPIETQNLPRRGLDFIRPLSRHDVVAGEIDVDVSSESFGLPVSYTLRTQGQEHSIDASRVVRFIPQALPYGSTGWGNSVLDPILSAIKQAASVAQGGATLVQEAAVSVVKVPKLAQITATNLGAEKLRERFSFANQGKSILNTMILDAEESWEQVSAGFAGIPDLLKMYLLLVSGAADIPATRMLGQSPAGLSSTGESDLRNYYDSVNAQQVAVLQPALYQLDQAIVQSTFGEWPDGLTYEWNSLWQMSETEKATRLKTYAEAMQIEASAGIVDPAILSEAHLNLLEVLGDFPNLAAIRAEHEAANAGEAAMELDETDPNVR